MDYNKALEFVRALSHDGHPTPLQVHGALLILHDGGSFDGLREMGLSKEDWYLLAAGESAEIAMELLTAAISGNVISLQSMRREVEA